MIHTPTADIHSRAQSSDVQPLVYLAVGVAWTLVAVGLVRQARREESRRKLRTISSRLLSQVFPNGLRP